MCKIHFADILAGARSRFHLGSGVGNSHWYLKADGRDCDINLGDSRRSEIVQGSGFDKVGFMRVILNGDKVPY